MLQKAEETTDLVIVEKLDVEKVFTKDGINELLAEIEKKVKAHVPDITTNQGRQDVISLAYKVSQSKTAIVKVGEASVAEYKKKVKDRNALLKTVKTRLDDLRDKTRKPVTDWEAEQERLEQEKQEEERKKNQARVDALLKVECVMPYIEVATMTDPEFDDLLMGKTLEFEEHQKEKAEAEVKAKAEAEALAKQKEEQEAEAKRLADEKAKLEAEAKAIQDERDRIAREEAEKKAAEEAEIEAQQKAQAKAAMEAIEAEEKRIAAEKEAERQEALKPDKQKMTEWLEKWSLPPEHPELKNDESVNLFENILLDFDALFQVHLKRIKDL